MEWLIGISYYCNETATTHDETTGSVSKMPRVHVTCSPTTNELKIKQEDDTDRWIGIAATNGQGLMATDWKQVKHLMAIDCFAPDKAIPTEWIAIGERTRRYPQNGSQIQDRHDRTTRLRSWLPRQSTAKLEGDYPAATTDAHRRPSWME